MFELPHFNTFLPVVKSSFPSTISEKIQLAREVSHLAWVLFWFDLEKGKNNIMCDTHLFFSYWYAKIKYPDD